MPRVKKETHKKPQKLTDINKKFMIEYVKGNPENLAWFKSIVNKSEYQHTVKRRNGEVTDINLKKVREAFCKKFFPELLEGKTKKSYIDFVNEL